MASSAPLVGVTPKAKRPRNSWFLQMTKVLGIYQFEIGYKNTRGNVSSYSKSKTSPKIPFGPPLKCEYYMKKNSDMEDYGVFNFTNKRRESAAFTESTMNNFNCGITEFSKKITSLIVEKKQKLLALYLSVLPHANGFVHHREESQDRNGFMLDGVGIQEKDLKINGGSLEDFLDFVEIAKASSTVIAQDEDPANPITQYFDRAQKNTGSNVSKPMKKSKVDVKNENEQKEIDDEEGLEKEYIKNYLGLAKIPLDNITVAPDLKSQLNTFRVRSIADSMKKYDPSISVLVVCPEEFNQAVNLNDVLSIKFHCIQKIHTLEAFHHLDKEGKFQKLLSHGDRKVACYVIKTKDSGLRHYGHLRPTAIESQFVKKIYPQELLHIFDSLSKEGGLNSAKVVERMSRLCRIGANEATSITKLCKWSPHAFTQLMKVVELYEKYETLDVKPNGHQGRLARGEKFPITNKLFNQLAKVDETYFLSVNEKVLSKNISLKYLVEEYETLIKVEKVTKVLSVLAGHKSYEQIKQEFPGKFETKHMKTFIGAEMKEGKILNENASRLEKYYSAVINEDSSSEENLLEFNEFQDLQELRAAGVFLQFDTVLLLLGQESKDACLDIIDHVLKSDRNKVAIIVFPTEPEYFKFMSYIRNKDTSLIKDFEAKPLIIGSESKGHQVLEENVKFGILLGKFDGLKTPIKTYQSSFGEMKSVIESISPPGRSTVVVADKLPLIKVHCAESTGKVAYYGSAADISNLKLLLAKEGNFLMCSAALSGQGENKCEEISIGFKENNPESVQKVDALEVFDFKKENL